MFKSYTDVRDWLENFIPQTYSKKDLGLEQIKYLLKLLGNPEKKFKSIHVGGTSGKGTTAFYIARLLQYSSESAGQRIRGSEFSEIPKNRQTDSLKHRFTDIPKIGLHLSPHLIYLGERMQINNRPIKSGRLVELVNEIKPYVEEMKSSKVGAPSYFEILVALSFKHFADEKVDWAVVEVGLGGKYDATNVLKPEVSVITNVGLDHMDILGNTIEKIAEEKAGIIKKNVPIVTGASGKALKLIENVAKEKKAQLFNFNTQLGVKHLRFDIFKPSSIFKEILRDSANNLALFNVFLAFTVVSCLKIRVDMKLLEKIFRERFTGRFEEIEDGVILDGAHNTDKIEYLIRILKNSKIQNPKSNITLVLAFKKGKDWKKMVDLLVKKLCVKKVISTEFQAPTDMGFFASIKTSEIEKYVGSKPKRKVQSFRNSQEAVFEAANNRKDGELVLVTGSLYLVGEVRTLWKLPEF